MQSAVRCDLPPHLLTGGTAFSTPPPQCAGLTNSRAERLWPWKPGRAQIPLDGAGAEPGRARQGHCGGWAGTIVRGGPLRQKPRKISRFQSLDEPPSFPAGASRVSVPGGAPRSRAGCGLIPVGAPSAGCVVTGQRYGATQLSLQRQQVHSRQPPVPSSTAYKICFSS